MIRFVTSLALCASVLVWVGSDAGAQGEDPSDVVDAATISPGRLTVDTIHPGHRHDGDDHTHPQALAIAEGVGPVTGVDVGSGLRLCFDSSVPGPARTAAIRAAQAWHDTLVFKGPLIEIDITWTSFPSDDSLAIAGPGSFVEHPDLPLTNHRYPVALANDLLQVDFAPRPECDRSADPEVVLILNATARGAAGSWHFGTEPPPRNAIDLTSVVLHELAHGFGFAGSAERTEDGELSWPEDGGQPYVFDASSRGCRQIVIDACGSGQLTRTNVGDLRLLTGNDLWFKAGLTNFELHAPPVWDIGTSYSHLSEDRYPPLSGAALMTPYIEPGEQHRGVDHATAAVMQELGWQLAQLPSSTTRIGLVPVDQGVQIFFGATLVGLTMLGEGPPPVEYEVMIQLAGPDGLFTEPFEPLVVGDPAFAITGLTNGQTYRLVVQGSSPAGNSPTVVTPTFVPGSSSDDIAARLLATQVFVDLRNDVPTDDETAAIANRVVAVGPGPAITELMQSPEFVGHASIVRLYLGFLGRVPDERGVEFWIGQYRQGRNGQGQSLTMVATRFAEASQFELGTRLSDQDFVSRVYETILGRSPELEGLVYWTGRLSEGMPRGRLLLEVSESTEHRATHGSESQVIATYIGLLDRVPTAEELQVGERLVEQGQIAQFVADVVNGSEYRARVSR